MQGCETLASSLLSALPRPGTVKGVRSVSFVLFGLAIGIELQALCLGGRHCTTVLCPQLVLVCGDKV